MLVADDTALPEYRTMIPRELGVGTEQQQQLALLYVTFLCGVRGVCLTRVCKARVRRLLLLGQTPEVQGVAERVARTATGWPRFSPSCYARARTFRSLSSELPLLSLLKMPFRTQRRILLTTCLVFSFSNLCPLQRRKEKNAAPDQVEPHMWGVNAGSFQDTS